MTSTHLWTTGDFAKIAPSAMIAGELLCDAVPTYAGQRVLDLGCGSGNTALAAARRRAQVWGADPVTALLARASERAAFEGLEISFVEAGAEKLPYDDGFFDVVLSTFGMVFCEHPQAAVAEVARVLRVGGKLGFTSWTEGGMTDQLFAKCLEAKPGMPSVEVEREWGRMVQIPALLRPHFGGLRIEHRKLTQRAASVEQWLVGMKKFLSPAVVAYEGLGPDKAAELDRQLLEMGAKHNEAPEHGFYARVPYLEVHCDRLAT